MNKDSIAKKFEQNVRAMNATKDLEYLCVADVKYQCTQQLRITSRIPARKISNEENRIMAVLRKSNGSLTFVLLYPPTENNPIDYRNIHNNKPLNRYTVDSSFRGNFRGNVIDCSNLIVRQKNCNTFTLEDTKRRVMQTTRTTYDVKVFNDSDGGSTLRQILVCEMSKPEIHLRGF